MARAVVHIGMHKTGSTSLQRWAAANREAIHAATGLRYYRGWRSVSHFELSLLSQRPDRNQPRKSLTPDWCLPSLQAELRAHITDQVAGGDDLLVSAESLSFLRHDDEVARLCELLSPREVVFIAVLRDPPSFLPSYRAQMRSMGFPPSPYPESFAYVEDDTWVADHDALRAAFPGLITIPHRPDQSVIPHLFEALGHDRAVLPDWSSYWLNTSSSRQRNQVPRLKRARRRLRSIRRRLTGAPPPNRRGKGRL